ncbi:MAG: UbiX family flavin prenyltransferase [Alphaproteobacteria bacterium]|nr:UbiX family flavin prenyltransferase [Alphaproteobacteria bacterium]
MTRRIVVGIGGASGQPYAQRVLAFLADHRDTLDLDVHVVFSRTGRLVWQDEVGEDAAQYGFPIHPPGDMTAPFASGSSRFDAMVVVPCSAGGLARIAHGLSTDLIGRAADVMLKERRPLVLVLRESPYSLIHLENMAAVTRAGALVMPASPSFYSNPTTRTALLDTVTARILDQLGIDNALMRRWSGRQAQRPDAPAAPPRPDPLPGGPVPPAAGGDPIRPWRGGPDAASVPAHPDAPAASPRPDPLPGGPVPPAAGGDPIRPWRGGPDAASVPPHPDAPAASSRPDPLPGEPVPAAASTSETP